MSKLFTFLLIATLTLPTAVMAATLKELPGDGGVMMNMALLTANTSLEAAKERIGSKSKEKYSLDYKESYVAYDQSKDRLVVFGEFTDNASPISFSKKRCEQFIGELRSDVRKTLADEKVVGSFIKTYSMMVKNKSLPKTGTLVSEVKKNMLLSATVNLASIGKKASCSGMVNSNSVSYNLQ